MFLRDFVRRILGMKPLEPGKHELDFTNRTARIEPTLGDTHYRVEAPAPQTTSVSTEPTPNESQEKPKRARKSKAAK